MGHNDRDDVKVKGEHPSNEDGIVIDAVIDGEGTKRLAVNANLKAPVESSIDYWGSNMCYEDMNVSTGGIARRTTVGSTWTRVYRYLGSGQLIGFLVTLDDADSWAIRLVVDGNEIFCGANGILTEDLAETNLYGFQFSTSANASRLHFLGLDLGDKTIRWEGPMDYPMKYSSSVEIYIKRDSSLSKKFLAGLVNLIKD